MNIIGKPSVRLCEGSDWAGYSGCDGSQLALYRSAMTAYHFDGQMGSEEDPNKPMALCDSCWEDYREYWQSKWNEYYSSLGV